jgi:hypothetical protein
MNEVVNTLQFCNFVTWLQEYMRRLLFSGPEKKQGIQKGGLQSYTGYIFQKK